MSKRVVLGTTAMLLVCVTGLARAEKTAPIWERTPDQQYDLTYRSDLPASAAILDQYNDKLSPNGRWGFVYKCFESYTSAGRTEQIILWALCGEDFKALDVAKLGLSDTKQSRIEEWKKIGTGIEAEAKDDPGVASILKQTEAAKADWKKFEVANHDAIVLYQQLKDGVRTSKSNDKNFDGCWDKTYPAFAKAVKATKFHWDNDGDEAAQGRVDEIDANPANYYAVANFGMCAYAAHATGAVLAGAAVRGGNGVAPMGWRSTLIAKILDPKFKPKFADRSLQCCAAESGATQHIRGRSFVGTNDVLSDVRFPWPGGSMKIQTGTITKLKKDGDDTTINFKGTMVDGCVKWVETRKIRTYDTAGQPQYERICQKRGQVEEDAPDPITTGTKFLEGAAPDVGLAMLGGYPVEAYNSKAKKFVAILGVAVKGSPAETPIKE